MIYAFLMTMPGVPYIYCGDEIGMRFGKGLSSKEGGYGRTGSRTPMQWNSGINAGFSTAPARELYLPLDPAANRPTVEAQENEPRSLLNHVRRLATLRRQHPALGGDGAFEPLFAKPDRYPFIYRRRLGAETFLVALNPSREPASAKVSLSDLPSEPVAMEVRGTTLHRLKSQWEIQMEGISYGIFKV